MNLKNKELEDFLKGTSDKFQDDTQFEEKKWEEFGLIIFHPELAQFRSGDECPEEWTMFINPQSKRVYSYLEAVDIVCYNNGDDLDEDCLCGKTKEIQTIIDKNNIEIVSNANLEVDFVLEDRKEHFYRYRNFKL